MQFELKDIKPDPDGQQSHPRTEQIGNPDSSNGRHIKEEVPEEAAYYGEDDVLYLKEVKIEYDPYESRNNLADNDPDFCSSTEGHSAETSNEDRQIPSIEADDRKNEFFEGNPLQAERDSPKKRADSGRRRYESVKIEKQKTRNKEPKRHQCSICDCRLSSSSNLKRHIQTHTGEKPFKCDACPYRCTSRSHLIRHKMIHSGEKPFGCALCPYKCTLLTNIKTHEMTHRGERPNKCDACPYKCTSSSDLKKHKTMHTGERAFRCDVCDCRFTRSDSLKKHKKIHTRLATVK